jgi:hypothetical protein
LKAGANRIRRWRDAALWTAGVGLAGVLMRLVARRVSGHG